MTEPTEDILLAQIIGYIASALSIFFFLSPIILFKEAFKTKDLTKIPFLMLLFNSLNCYFWIIYGFYLHQNPMWVCNILGITLNIIWLVCYNVIYFKENIFLRIFISIVYVIFTLSVIALGVLIFMYEENERKQFELAAHICGYIGCGVNVLMYLGPGQKLYQVYKTENYNLIPIISSLIGWACSFFWGFYALINKTALTKGIDLPAFIPHTIGFVLMPIQIIFWFVFSRKADKKGYVFDKDGNKKQKSVKKLPTIYIK